MKLLRAYPPATSPAARAPDSQALCPHERCQDSKPTSPLPPALRESRADLSQVTPQGKNHRPHVPRRRNLADGWAAPACLLTQLQQQRPARLEEAAAILQRGIKGQDGENLYRASSGGILRPQAEIEDADKLSLQCWVERLNPGGKDGVLRNYIAYFHDRCGFPLGSRQLGLVE